MCERGGSEPSSPISVQMKLGSVHEIFRCCPADRAGCSVCHIAGAKERGCGGVGVGGVGVSHAHAQLEDMPIHDAPADPDPWSLQITSHLLLHLIAAQSCLRKAKRIRCGAVHFLSYITRALSPLFCVFAH